MVVLDTATAAGPVAEELKFEEPWMLEPKDTGNNGLSFYLICLFSNVI